MTEHWKERSHKKYYRYRCKACNAAAVLNRKKRLKSELIELLGGKCARCGYDKSHCAMTFHHKDRSTKSFNLSQMTSFSREKVLAEGEKCELLCANCHFELEEELRDA